MTLILLNDGPYISKLFIHTAENETQLSV